MFSPLFSAFSTVWISNRRVNKVTQYTALTLEPLVSVLTMETQLLGESGDADLNAECKVG